VAARIGVDRELLEVGMRPTRVLELDQVGETEHGVPDDEQLSGVLSAVSA
jgi:hypothetical protein